MGLFDRVFRGSDEMYFKAEAELNNVIAELGDPPGSLPSPSCTNYPPRSIRIVSVPVRSRP